MMRPLNFVPLFAVALLTACATSGGSSPTAGASLAATRGNTVAGTVSVVESDGEVRVTAEITGLSPGPHGFHVHEKGDCSAPDGTSAGGHFNPGGKVHGHPGHGEHHAGDLPQLVADASGVARLSASTKALSVSPGETSVVGRSVIVHAGPDDFKSQPAGNSGPRVACGVIAAR